MKTTTRAAHAAAWLLAVGLLAWSVVASAVSTAPAQVPGITDATAIAAGGGHILVLRSDATVWAWGSNSSGQLGDGTTTDHSSPVQVAGLPAISAIAAGNLHSLALARDGSVWAWGSDGFGQLGDADPGTQKTRPVRVAGVSNVQWIAAGDDHSLALGTDGVRAWGFNAYGQLGDGTTTNRSTPVAVIGLANVARISAGGHHSAAAMYDNTLWMWGHNSDGQLGDGTRTDRAAPVRANISDVWGVEAAGSGARGFTMALVGIANRTVRAWGANDHGQLGDGTTAAHTQPAPVNVLADVSWFSGGAAHAVALTSDGGVWTWGDNASGQLGVGTTNDSSTPHRVAGLPGAIDVAAGDGFTAALASDGSVWTWGKLGDAPVANPPSLPAAAAVASCVDHTFEMDSRGGLWAQGTYAPNLQPAFNQYPVPISFGSLPGGVRAQAVACGTGFSLVLAQDGSVWGHGFNSQGSLGIPDPQVSDYTRVPGIPAMSQVAVGSSVFPFVLALDRSGHVWGWGDNSGGQILPNAPSDRATPQQLAIPTPYPIVQVSAGMQYSMALDQAGTVWIWGLERPFFGSTGNLHTSYQVMPGLPRIAAISAGGYFALALANDGSVWSWGDNQYGSLGVGPLPQNPDAPYFFYPVPHRIPTLANVRSIAAGASHSLAMTADGAVWSWGSNATGEIGDGSAAQPQTGLGKDVPVRLNSLGAVRSVVAGPFSSAAISNGGALFMWGWNLFGKLGNGTFADQTRPQAVVGAGGLGFLDLTPEDPLDLTADKLPPFGVLLNAPGTTTVAIDGTIKPRSEDVGKVMNIYLFALAPASMVKDAPAWPKDAPVPCVLAQLSANGELRTVSASQLQDAVHNTVMQSDHSVNLATNASSGSLTLSTLFMGYGTSPSSMFKNGTNRSVASFSQQGDVPCVPQTPKTGWWWNAAEGGRGYSIEVQGNHVFFAAFHYDPSGRATWNFATGNVSMDGSFFMGDLLGARGGQTLTGAYPGLPAIDTAGEVILAFNDATHGTMVWPGGAVALERLPFVPNGLTAVAQADLPEAGWWWNPQENGRGFFVEWQNGSAQIAGYMYDASGNPIWYLSGGPTPDPNAFSAPLRLYGNGQSMLGAYRLPTLVNDNAGTLGLRFLTRDTATLTLPGARQVPLQRMRF